MFIILNLCNKYNMKRIISSVNIKKKLNINKTLIANVLRLGTFAIILTLSIGHFFGKSNMMITFVMVLGINIFDQIDLTESIFHKFYHLFFLDLSIILISFLASYIGQVGFVINILALFFIIFFTIKLTDQISYKTFMMLYVFCNFNQITFSELPIRIFVIMFVLSMMLLQSLLNQLYNKKRNEFYEQSIFTYTNLVALRKGDLKDLEKQITFHYFTQYFYRKGTSFYLEQAIGREEFNI